VRFDAPGVATVVISLHGTEPINLRIGVFRKIAAVIKIAADDSGGIKGEFRVPKERLFGRRRTAGGDLALRATRLRAEQIRDRVGDGR